jgi:glycosyltransferase involved in cell wall biosynthesis
MFLSAGTLKYAVFSKVIFRWKQPIVFRNASTISLYIKGRWAILWNRLFFSYASKIISVSNASARDFGKLFPSYENRITTIPIGIEVGKADATKIPAALNGIQLRDNSGPVLIHVGGFTFEKNHVSLISIFEKILQQQPTATLHLIGDGPLKAEIESLVHQKGLSSQIKFYGFQKQAIHKIKQADVLLLPSIIEGLPGVILEAFFCKTPVVAYNVGGIGEILINNKTGRLIKKGDELTFANSVLEALEKNDKNECLVQRAYHLVTSQYLNTRISKDFLDVYSTMLSL